MEFEDMKDLWAGQAMEEKQKEVLAKMIRKKSHPILKKISRQLALEAGSWLVVLSVYYSMFDGQMRPWVGNGVFIIGILQAIAFNISAYLAARNLIQGDNLVSSLSRYIIELRKFKWISLFSRIIMMGAILFFFLYGLEMNTRRTFTVLFISLIFAGQLWFLQNQWSQKISKLVRLKADFTIPG